MKTARIFYPFLIIASTLLLFSACEETPVGPSVGSGTLLKAVVLGESYTFDIDDAEYNPSVGYGSFTGSTNADPVQSITISFSYDLDKGTFPATLVTPDGGIAVALNSVSGGTTKSYQLVTSNAGSVVLKVSDGEIVDGTFSGTLENTQDASDKITVTNGEFSVKMTRN